MGKRRLVIKGCNSLFIAEGGEDAEVEATTAAVVLEVVKIVVVVVIF